MGGFRGPIFRRLGCERFDRVSCLGAKNLHFTGKALIQKGFLSILGDPDAIFARSHTHGTVCVVFNPESLRESAEATYAEYRRQKANERGKRGFRLPLW